MLMIENRKIPYYDSANYPKENEVQYNVNNASKTLSNDVYSKPLAYNRSHSNIYYSKNKQQKINKKNRSSSSFKNNNNLRSYVTKYNNHIYTSK